MKKRGRPLGSSSAGVRGCMFQVRLSTSERAKIGTAARRVGLPTSTWARMTLLAATKGRRA